MVCVNALNGLLSFLQQKGYSRGIKDDMCVNALNGLLSFLQNIKKITIGNDYDVSTP